MGFWNKLFGKKGESKEEVKEAEPSEQEVTEAPKRPYLEEICGLCKQPIGTARWKKTGNYFVHKKCAKKMAKDIMNGR